MTWWRRGYASSMARPGGNTTGVNIFATELDGKRQEILIEAVPGLRRMAALADARNTTAAKLNELQAAARAQNIDLSIHQVVSGDEIAAAIDMARSSGATAVNVLASPMLHANFELINDRVITFRWPAIYQWPALAEAGGFAAYGRVLPRRATTKGGPTDRQGLPWYQARRSSYRTADQIQLVDQP